MSSEIARIADTAKRILVIDDDQVVLAIAQAVLEAGGYEVFTHLGAFGVTQQLRSCRPDLVLLDVNMPALSGRGVAEMIRSKDWAEGIRILFFSSSDEKELKALVEETGADGFVRKGDHEQLTRQVAQMLRA